MKNVTRLLFSKLMMLFVLSTMLFTQVGRAEVVVTLGTGTITSQNTHPFYTFYEDGRSQYIYLASEMAGLSAGPITKLAVNFYQAGTYPMAGFYIKMQNTTMTSNTSAFVETGWTDVYYNPSYVVPGTGWQTFVFNLSNFIWDGTSNIIVQYCWDNDDYISSYSYLYMTSQAEYRSIYRYTDGVAGCSMAASYISYYRPNMKLYQPSPATLTGTVTSGATGLPIVGAVITSPSGATTTSGAGGAYTLNTFEGTGDFTCTYPGFLLNTVTLTLPAGGTVTHNWVMLLPPSIQGTVTNAANGNPIKGAKITVQGEDFLLYSVQGGTYPTQMLAQADMNLTVTCTKPGFDNKSMIINFPGGTTVTVDFALNETANKASQPFTAALNTGNTAVNLNWGLPTGYYELIYDDGIKDLTTVWATGGNMNAVKFTGLNDPIRVYRGSVNIGDATDYPFGTDPSTLAPFQLQLYDATGTGGMPGNPLGDPMDIQPTQFGWIEFTLPASQYIGSGNFYLVMTQGGNSDVAARLGVDNSSNNLRAFSRFVTSGGPWLPADGNFMMRLVVRGTGGPLTDLPEGIVNYQVWRLLQGNETLQGTWNSVGTTATTSLTDNSWASLPDSAYRWAVKVQYTGARWSDPIFSNALGKNRTANVVVNVTLTCAAHPLDGSVVTLTSMMPVEDSVYTATTDATGKVTFPKVWKAPYTLSVNRTGYEVYSGDVSVYGDRTFDVTVLMQKSPPYNMYVEDVSLLATWNPPSPVVALLNEDWESASFVTNGWTNASGIWEISAGAGNPGYAAEIYWGNMLTNYDNINLESRVLTGSGSPDFKFYYDIYLNNYSATGAEYMTVEIAEVGQPWVILKEYSNTASIPWTTEIIDIAAYTNKTFQVRFRCHGADMFDFNYWDIDNIKVVVTVPDPSACILAYNVYLNSILDGVTVDTFYTIPPNHVAYGQPYQACVKAVYGSGYSNESCYNFISKFLYPPTNLAADSVECVAYLTWVKPAKAGKVNVPAFKGTVENTVSSTGRAPMKKSDNHNQFTQQNISIGYKGSIAFGAGYDGNTGATVLCSYDIDNVSGYTYVADDPLAAGGDFIDGMTAPVGELEWVYACNYYDNHLYQVDKATGGLTDLGALAGGPAGFNEIAIDKTTGVIYGFNATAGTLYSIDPNAMTATSIGSFVNANVMIAIGCDGNGDMWGYDIGSDQFYSIDKTTGLATFVGALGFNAAYAQSMTYDPVTDNVILNAFNGNNSYGEIRAVDVTTGASVILSTYYFFEVCGAYIPLSGGGGEPEGLIGYKVYRDGGNIATINDKEITEYYDFTVNPGIHNYEVSALYDLEPYGFPGQFGESMLEGPDECNISGCGIPLPFYEPWNTPLFEFNNWSHVGNWTISSAYGNPAPSADFQWLPPTSDYDMPLTTPVINASSYTCATIWCDFDYKLEDRFATGDEFLTVQIFKNGSFTDLVEFANNGSVDWTSQHLELKGAKGKAFSVAFRANGTNTQDILHWYVDNIHIYAVCTPPTELGWYDINDKDVYLNWTPPSCKQGPPETWLTWDDGTNVDGIGLTAGGSFDVAAKWDASMISQLEGGSILKVKIWPNDDATYSFRAWEGDAGDVLIADQPFAPPTGDWYEYTCSPPVPIDVTKALWVGYNATHNAGYYPAGCDGGPNVAGYGMLANLGSGWEDLNAYFDYNWDIEVLIGTAKGTTKSVVLSSKPIVNANTQLSNSGKHDPIGQKQITETDASNLLGYNVYRLDPDSVNYYKRNQSLLSDTTFFETVPVYGQYHYFVTAVFETGDIDCESDSSNILPIDIVPGINDPINNGSIMVYPNPATDIVNVKSNYTISQIEVLNYIGQTVYNRTNLEAKTDKINVANFQTGVYFVKVTTDQGVRTVKITVTK